MGIKAVSIKKPMVAFCMAFLMLFSLIVPPAPGYAASGSGLPARQAEYLDRGLIAVLVDNGVYLSWRYLNTDSDEIAFNVYKNGYKVNSAPISGSTNYVDTTGADSSQYQISTVIDGKEEMQPATVPVWHNNYLPIPLDKPADGRTKDGGTYSYYAGDASVGDLDGDGEYEIVFLWSPSNSKDNSQAGYTGNVYIDAVKLDGTKLWRIDLGVNIRAGAHYTQLMVYDLDGNGKAEVVVKTADGTKDGQGKVIGDGSKDYRNDGGYILTGPEYLTLFDGLTGAAVSTVDYIPPRGDVSSWGDGYGNRVDRFLGGIAYLDGVKPSVVMARGYYTRTVLTAYDYTGGQLVPRWTFDTKDAGQQYEGQGNHNLSVLDADGDGKDEIMYGALAIDDDGSLMYSTGLGHGDAMHAGRLDPNRDGYQIVSVHEHSNAEYGLEMRDAATGDILWGQYTGKDTGRGMSADIDPNYPGYESWASTIVDGQMDPLSRVYAANGEVIYEADEVPKSANFAIWWDGDLQRELFDHEWDNSAAKGIPLVYKWDYESKQLKENFRATGTLTNNHTKGNPALQGDILGDWREELLLRSEDSSEYRLYTTTIPTSYRIPTLMQDPVYRLGIAWQNVGYNQPPHTGFYLGTEATEFPKANLTLTGGEEALQPVYHFGFGTDPAAGTTAVQDTQYTTEAGYGFENASGITVGAGSATLPENAKFAVDLPNANYKITLKLGDETRASNVGVKSEFVQKLAATSVNAGEPKVYSYDVALVDGQLEFIFSGTAIDVQEILIEKYPEKTPGAAATIYMAGDSTMQSYSDMQAPQEGWGQEFGRYFANGVVVQNESIGGRSSKSFMVDGRLDSILQRIKPGDYFFISFGHNDASAGIPERYASPADYKTYLARYVNGAIQRGAMPVLLTPVGRRDFNTITQEFNVSFPEYVQAAKEVAEELDVTLIDLSQLSIAYYDKIGLAATEKLFLYANPGEYPKYPNGVNDNTHFSGYGAQVIAGLVAGAVKELELGISPFVIDPDLEEPEPEPEIQVYEEDFEGDQAAVEYAMVNATGIAGTMAGTVVDQSGNKVLSVAGSGSGNRAKVFRLFDAVNGDIVHVNFDWHSGNVSAFPSEGHLTLQDANENIILTLLTKTGTTDPGTKIHYYSGPYTPDYGTGSTAVPEGGTATTLAKNQWVNVDATINFAEKTIDLTLTSLANPSLTQTIEDIEMYPGVYTNNVRAIRFLGTRKGGGGTLNWTTQIDNVKIEGTKLEQEAGDQTALIALRDEVKALDLSGYTEASVTVLNKALAAAEALIGTEATQAQVDHVFNMLTVAKDSLTSEPAGEISKYQFDFGSGSTADGYMKVDAKRAYLEGNGYGFADTALVEDENRETGDALTEDFTRVNGTSFLVEMEPANYRVTMTVGDVQESTNTGVTIEQMPKMPVTTVAKGQFTEVTYDIALIDGVFDFAFSGGTPKINALTIERLPENGAGDQPVLYLASDSTVANYAESYRPQAGWGETLGGYFDLDEISIDNRAVSGLSSKTFLVGGYLNDILLDIHEGDYLFMQWSHNDSTPSRPERYLTPEQFKVYLKDYINGTLQRGATPVLVTPVNRRDFTGDVLNKSFPDYVKAMKETAQETGTLLVDLNQASWEYFQELGPEGTKSIFMWVGTTEDNTHLQMNGAIKVSEMVARLVQELNIPLSELVTLEEEPADGKAPHTTAAVEGESQGEWYTSAVQVKFTAADEDSAVEATYYKVNAGEAVSGTELTLSEEGSHTVTYWSVDVDGNKENEQTLSVAIDLAPPALEIQGQTEYTIDQQVEIGYTASDSVSGVPAPGGVVLSAPAYTLEPGLNTVTAEVYDLAGHTQTVDFSFGVTATFASLAELTHSFAAGSADPDAAAVAGQLSAKLLEAEQAATAHQGAKVRQLLAAYSNDVSAVGGTVFTAEQAAALGKWASWLSQATPLASGAPGMPVLSDNNGHDTGLKDGDYTVTMNLWWGNNGSRFKLYENGELVKEVSLVDQSPSAQSVKIDIAGKKNGTYVYTGELINALGTTKSAPLTVTVTDASPGQAVLSNDNWDGDGSFKVTMNLWWGTNATEYELYENGVLVDSQSLEARTPGAQSAVTAISGKAKGTYEYVAVLRNAAGETRTAKMVVTVR
ncbi:GDSL-type esterase/lipase family protein [Paenibacillus tengchongensis]|uniref:rhamnogalacturonan lyase family protein n=1 Tax=Paenibacillus tengchongensis TaxID=2608684 RepID=UPI00124DB666|nr:GDSL-type esterase/lipase family protein [Paenibacillus tengchongensis]